MSKAQVKIVYRQVIDESCSSGFEKAVFQASYEEFLLKSQAYNQEGKFKTFSKIKANDGRANSLHYKLSFSVGHACCGLTVMCIHQKLSTPYCRQTNSHDRNTFLNCTHRLNVILFCIKVALF